MPDASESWPALPYAEWKDTCDSLHLWSQIVGKIRLARAPWLNHSWQVTLHPTVRGLTTGPIPASPADGLALQIELDLVDHLLHVATDAGGTRALALEPRTVADFRAALFGALEELGVKVAIRDLPSEIPDAIPFSEDTVHSAYDAAYARRFARVLLSSHLVFERFRTGFLGKSSPSHFFWGSFDLAVTRFSGRRAPLHPGGNPTLPDSVAREAYSHEVASAGFWPGGAGADDAAYYAYAYPEPKGYGEAKLRPADARYLGEMGLWVLPYESVRTARDPAATLLEFLQTAYAAAADLADWSRAELDCAIGRPGVPRPVP
jgi:hypothetical protein